MIASAKALILVSRFEGFGIPIIEAMACNVPVIVSNSSAMPEIAATAGFYIDPDSVKSIADGIYTLDTNSEVRLQLIENGQLERQRFSWDESARKLWSVVKQVLKV
jgi:glycosyltransferase involved in cell wall biosynthesis